MRYFKLVVGSDADPMISISSRNNSTFLAGKAGTNWDAGALEVEFDIPNAYQGGAQNAQFTIHGVPLEYVSQAMQYEGAKVQFFGGQSPGMPLATLAANQAGLLFTGTIYSAVGNWVGTELSITFFCYPGYAPLSAIPGMYQLSVKKGENIPSAVKKALKPWGVSTAEWTKNVIAPEKIELRASNPTTLANIIAVKYRSLFPKLDLISYIPVSGVAYEFRELDPKQPIAVLSKGQGTKVAITDVIGQPSWNGLYAGSISTVLRADIPLGGRLIMPVALGISTSINGSTPAAQYNPIAMRGSWHVVSVRHSGKSRSPDDSQWSTTFELQNSTSPQSKIIDAISTGDGYL